MGPPSHLFIQIGAQGLPTLSPACSCSYGNESVAMYYKHLEHTFSPSPAHFSRSSYTMSRVSAVQDSKIDVKCFRPQRTWGAWTITLIPWCGPSEEACSLKTQRSEGHWGLASSGLEGD